MIALSVARFPRGTRSPMLDAIARAPIWAAGIDYGHGTGHGVGYFMNVHEGPQSISPTAMPEPHTAMEPGMITSIEPGIYRPGRWGIRIENLVLNRRSDTDRVRRVPRLRDADPVPDRHPLHRPALLRGDEVAWLNDYHAQRARAPAAACRRRRARLARTAHEGDLMASGPFHPRQRRRRPPQAAHRHHRLFDGAHRRRPLLPVREAPARRRCARRWSWTTSSPSSTASGRRGKAHHQERHRVRKAAGQKKQP
jgi:hypothetical protein